MKTEKHPEGWRIKGTNLIVCKCDEIPKIWGSTQMWVVSREGRDENLLEAPGKAEAVYRVSLILSAANQTTP